MNSKRFRFINSGPKAPKTYTINYKLSTIVGVEVSFYVLTTYSVYNVHVHCTSFMAIKSPILFAHNDNDHDYRRVPYTKEMI